MIPTQILDALAVGSGLSIAQKQKLKEDMFRNYPKDYALLSAWFCPKCGYKNYEAYARADCPNKLCLYCRHESPKEQTTCFNCGAPL
jgi:rubrerythrin